MPRQSARRPARRASSAEDGDQLGLPVEAVDEQAARCRAAGTAGGPPPASRGTWRPAARRRCGRVGQRPQAEQAEVGVGRLRQPVEQQRQHLLHQPRRPGQARRSAPASACRVRSASVKPNAASRSLDGRRSACADRPGERLEQRAEVQPLVDRPHGRLVAPQLVVELLDRGRASACRGSPAPAPGARAPRRRSGTRVDLLLVDQLEPVLDRAQEPVGVGERRGVVGVDVAGAAQLGEGVERRGRAQRRVVRGRARAAAAAPRTRCRGCRRGPASPRGRQAPAGHLAPRPAPSGRAAPGGRRRRTAAPTPAAGRRPSNGVAQLGVAGDGPRLEQRLELPRLRPSGPSTPRTTRATASSGPSRPSGRRSASTRKQRAGDVHHARGRRRRRPTNSTSMSLA